MLTLGMPQTHNPFPADLPPFDLVDGEEPEDDEEEDDEYEEGPEFDDDEEDD